MNNKITSSRDVENTLVYWIDTMSIQTHSYIWSRCVYIVYTNMATIGADAYIPYLQTWLHLEHMRIYRVYQHGYIWSR